MNRKYRTGHKDYFRTFKIQPTFQASTCTFKLITLLQFFATVDKFYDDIVKCISTAITDVIPKRKRPISSFNFLSWNTFVQEKHEAAKEAFLMWVDSGRPRFGYDFDAMKRTRALFIFASFFASLQK